VTGVAETLDSALKERLRAVLGQRPVTEAELRKLSEQGRACTLILGAQLARSEHRLAELALIRRVRSPKSRQPFAV
jgi:hypothetical protein